ncbi:MAG TPA: hypothetical protein VFT62_07205 [Mycobacteriales bacterium]|nr:hypothetical protein [Mycobacteriales bacterium]
MTDGRRQLIAVGAVGGRGAAAVADTIRDTHLAIADRAFTMSGPGALPAHRLHDAISRGVYASVATGVRFGGLAAGYAAARRSRRRTSTTALTDRPRGATTIGALNGAWGDWLHAERSPLALPMTVRRDDRDVPLDDAGLRAAYPDATGDLAVFLHGLCESDVSWRLHARRHYGDARSTHATRLQAELGLSPVTIRYNTGRHICDNGDTLAHLLSDLVEHWPVAVERITFVGHSMGGLVARAACHRAEADDFPWLDRVARVVYLGAPHLGAPLEVAATAAALALRRLPETRPLARALASRSVGIKDLRYGDVTADDWSSLADLDAWRSEPAGCTPLLASADHYFLGVTLGQQPDTRLARIVGDALVPWSSASGAGPRRRLEVSVDRSRHLGGLHHFDLLNHPRVYAVLQEWLA